MATTQAMDGGSLFEEMTEKNTSERKLASDTHQAAKKPYLKPEFRYERAFETMALACGKVRATQGLCRFNRKNS